MKDIPTVDMKTSERKRRLLKVWFRPGISNALKANTNSQSAPSFPRCKSINFNSSRIPIPQLTPTCRASSYDRMNDLMSLGIHRLWKDHFVHSLNPGFSALPSSSSQTSSTLSSGYKILDIAGGTGDIAFRLLHHAHTISNSPSTTVTISDINSSMLAEGKKRSLSTPWAHSPSLDFLLANAEDLRAAGVADNSIDLYTVAFGIRNFTDKNAALREAYRVLKPGGVFACLEFSKVQNPIFDAVYKRWSFGAIPLIGQLVAGDRASYQYLVESIERFPGQEEFRDMIVEAGFVVPGRGWEDLSGGIAAIHKGVKPVVK
jgi:2-methoxy-6-polyprenyl-1,4-benzoquinol methylase